jgi:3-isopropylmalate/(R)-2-methylmalate dehydratase large subunit
MGMTMVQKIFARAAGLPEVKPGQLVLVDVDLVLGNDITTPVAIDQFERAGFRKVFNKSKIAMVMDHSMPNKDIKSAQLCKQCRTFSGDYGVQHFYDVGRMGIAHAFLPEQGFIAPGEVIIGADSHTCTYGALNALGMGVGSTDMAAGMAAGKAVFRVPGGLKFNLTGKLQPNVYGKDVILHIIGKIGVDGALNKSMEYAGEGLKSLSMFDRLTISNMAVDTGAETGIFPVDEITREYLKNSKVTRQFTEVAADGDDCYDAIYDIDLGKIPPTVACPHLPSNIKPAKDIKNVKVDQVVIGSCTNGWLADMKIAAAVLKGKKVAPHVRVIIIPSTQAIYKECITNGYMDIFIDAGCAVSTPTCGPCLGGHMGVLADGEVAISTTNRNFVGRMGHATAQIYLCNPAVAAASAIAGYITEPKD